MKGKTMFKCMKKLSNGKFADQWNRESFNINETVVSSDQYGYCCLPTIEMAKELLKDYALDAIECETEAPWNTIVEIKVNEINTNGWSHYSNTVIAMNWTIVGEMI